MGISLTGLTYTQNFDTLASTGSSAVVPFGFEISESGTSGSVNGLYTAGTGSGNGGDLYSLGLAGSTDRALGGLRSGTLTPLFGASFTNDTGATITALTLAYAGEQWRLGTSGRADRLDFQYSTNATSITTGTWTDYDPLDFVAPISVGTVGALNGNLAANRVSITSGTAGFDIPDLAPGTTIWIRWVDLDATSADDALGIDDFSLTPVTAAIVTETQSVTIAASQSLAEGNTGTTAFTFTIARTGGTTGDVSFTASFAAGTTDAADFAGGTLPGSFSGTILAGQASATITVNVAGDTTFEANEAFTVSLATVSNSNAAITTAIGAGSGSVTGTITNDDAAPPAPPANVFINEIHYDNGGTDAGEAIEIAGVAGTNLAGYRLVLYNGGTNGVDAGAATAYATINLAGIIDSESNGYGALSFATLGLQNGPADGIALIGPDGTVIQFLSYEGVITAAAGTPAAGLTSTDIGVFEGGSGAVGNSLALTGIGATGADFAFQNEAPSSFGSLNPGQTIVPDNGTGLISVADASVIEGDAGTSQLAFTVRRAGGLGQSATVDYTISLNGTANAADLAPGAVLTGTVTFAVGATSAKVFVPIAGDTVGEGNETLSITLSNPVGNVSIFDGAATGTITNDDPLALVIGAIQGEGHRSEYTGQVVVTTGVVTGVDTNGFFLQSATGDGNARTSDGIFVFTSTAPTVVAGDAVSVRGTVAEFQASAVALTLTELTAPTVTVLSQGNALPAALLIGAGGILPPNMVIEDDGFTSFDPATDGIDFWESLEGMRVTIETPQAVSNTNGFGETDVVASFGAGATGVNDRGGITLSAGDFNPEKIQIDTASAPFSTPGTTLSVGDQLASVTGIVNYAFNNYEVIATQPLVVTKDVTLTQEVTNLGGDATHLTLATYNLENLDPGDNKYALLAEDIVLNLGAPDILAVQEIQDADGAGGGADLSGQTTAQGLIDAIAARGGPTYVYIEIAPTTANSTGGEPNGNIRNGYFYNPDRVDYLAGSAILVPGTAFNGTRSPLAATFSFNGESFTTIDVHFTSRGGSEPLWGDNQPPLDAGDSARVAQAAAVKAYVDSALATNPNLQFAVLGDFNGFYFERFQTQLTDGGVFTNLNSLLPVQERYSYLFEGNNQQLDNILVTGGLLDRAAYDAVHLNSQFVDNPASRPTDHDPQLARLYFDKAPTALALADSHIDENSAAGTVVGTLAGTDTAGDVLTYVLLDNAGGLFAVDQATGVITATATFDFEGGPTSYAIVAKVTDQDGKSLQQNLTITVDNVNEAPFALALNGSTIAENQPAGTLVGTLAGTDVEPGALSYSLIDNAGGRFAVNAMTGAITATAPLNFEGAASYTVVAAVTDAGGLSFQKGFTVAVTDVNEAPFALALTGASIAENQPAGTLVGTLAGTDVEAGALSYSLVDNAGGRFAVNATTGAITATAPLNFEGAVSYTVVAAVTDAGGLSFQKGFTIAVTDVNETPVAVADAVAVNEDATTANLWTTLLANDTDPDAGTVLGITAVDTTGTLGSVLFDPATQSLRFVADADAYDALAPGAMLATSFTYTATDAGGLSSTATVTVTVTGLADGITLNGGNGVDNLTGTGGEDTLSGGRGDDILSGLDGHDVLDGGQGSDTLRGGAGNDLLIGGQGDDFLFGGSGKDVFVIGKATGNDLVFDFSALDDRIAIVDGQSLKGIEVRDANGDGQLDTVISASQGGKITLLGVSDPGSVHIDIGLGLYGPVLSGGDMSAAHEMQMAHIA